MYRIQLDEDIKPLSEFRANASRLIQHVKKTKRPLVLTQRGKSSAVLIDVAEYEELLYNAELQRDIKLAEEQIEKGMLVSHLQTKKRVLSKIKK